ncbi:MAG: hypothetical protein HYZ53_02400 [Planctomycetes bacterium]|nr:hypothetical protein [Planctomycetota bacterium]
MNSFGAVCLGAQVALIPGLYAVGRALGVRLSRTALNGLCVAALACILAYPLVHLRPDLEDAWFPQAYVYFEGTWLALPVALLLSIASRVVKSRIVERGCLALTCLLSIQTVVAGSWVFREPADLKPSYWIRDVYRQSTDYTCGAAALMTALRIQGIDSTEEEMARLSMTGKDQGTTMLRLAYALRRKLEGSDWKVAILRLNESELRRVRKPLIIDTKYEYLVDHIVVLLKLEEEARGTLAWVGDPLMGHTPMPFPEVVKLWRGYGICMFKVSPFESP